MTLFYAYIHNIRNDDDWRMVIVFGSRAIADQWWRAISSIKEAHYFKRISPQFYTHDDRCNVSDFFTKDKFKPICEQFRGKMFITNLHNKGGPTLSIIPLQAITDHISGNWFYIRSTANCAIYWHIRDGKLVVSEQGRTQFQVKARNLQDGTIMIGDDQITLHVDHRLHVDMERSGALVTSGVPREFKFDDIGKGAFSAEEGSNLTYDSSSPRQQRWELV